MAPHEPSSAPKPGREAQGQQCQGGASSPMLCWEDPSPGSPFFPILPLDFHSFQSFPWISIFSNLSPGFPSHQDLTLDGDSHSSSHLETFPIFSIPSELSPYQLSFPGLGCHPALTFPSPGRRIWPGFCACFSCNPAQVSAGGSVAPSFTNMSKFLPKRAKEGAGLG